MGLFFAQRWHPTLLRYAICSADPVLCGSAIRGVFVYRSIAKPIHCGNASAHDPSRELHCALTLEIPLCCPVYVICQPLSWENSLSINVNTRNTNNQVHEKNPHTHIGLYR
jgi:hypothetical protein